MPAHFGNREKSPFLRVTSIDFHIPSHPSAMPLPLRLPELPEGHWDAQVHSGYDQIRLKYRHITRLLAQERATDPVRLSVLAEDLEQQHTILGALLEHGLPAEWIEQCATQCLLVLNALQSAHDAARGKYVPTMLSPPFLSFAYHYPQGGQPHSLPCYGGSGTPTRASGPTS